MAETVQVSGLYRQCRECFRAVGYGVKDAISVCREGDVTFITPHAPTCPTLVPKPEPVWSTTIEVENVDPQALALLFGSQP